MSRVAVRVTLRTLARDLGVSAATVSNAYNRPDQLSPALRRKILERAEELGFAGPDPVARGLRRGRVGAIGVLVDQGLSHAFSDPAVVLILDGLADEVQADGSGLLLHAAVPEEADPASGPAPAMTTLVRSAAVDAWVVASVPSGHRALAAAQAQGRPLVVLDQPDLPGVPGVTVDDEGGVRSAAEHLLGLGHRRIAVLSSPLHVAAALGPASLERQATATRPMIARRLAGARSALAAAGQDWSQVLVVECADNSPVAGAAGARLALEAEPVPTALLCLTDQLALGALRYARDSGIDVPGRLSVVGFDDAPAAATAYPPLTTVRQPLRERGIALGQLLRGLLAGQEVEPPAPFPTRLVVRESSGPPPTPPGC